MTNQQRPILLLLCLTLVTLAATAAVNGQGGFGSFLNGHNPDRSGIFKVTAVDLAGQPVEGFHIFSDGYGLGNPEKMIFSPGAWQVMLCKPQANGVTLFSRALPLRIRLKQTIRMRNVRMQPGLTIRGRLSDQVPRPIKRGFVITNSCPLPKPEGDGPSLAWQDWTNVDEKGSFELKSVPSHGEIQVIAMCDGWVSKSMLPANACVTGQLFQVNESMPDLLIEMEQTGSIEFALRTPDGGKLTDGKVSASPQQRFYHSGETMILGVAWRTIDTFRSEDPSPGKPRLFDGVLPLGGKMPFADVPVKDGTAILSGIPLGPIEPYVLFHNKFRFTNRGLGALEFQLKTADRKRVTLVVEE